MPGRAAWTDHTNPAGKGHKEVMITPRTAHTRFTVLRNSAFKKGEDRALDLLTQKTVARLEVLRLVPGKGLET